MMWESSSNGISPMVVAEDCCIDVSECASLITNSFTLNSGGPRPVATSRRTSTTTRQRHPLAALLHSNANNNNNNSSNQEDDDTSRSPARPTKKRMFTEDSFSMYDAENSHQGGDLALPLVSGSPRTTCSTLASSSSPTMLASDDEDDDDVNLPSADNSPVTFKVLETTKPLLNKLQASFDDAANDSSSMDSGYGPSQFRFTQPRGMAPRRLDSGIASPNVSSSLSGSKQARHSYSVFNRCSSEEEYALDCFQLEEESSSATTPTPALKIPNISNLISGAIISRTPSDQKTRVRRCLMLEESPRVNGGEEDKENCSPVIMGSNNKSAQKKEEFSTGASTPKRTNLMQLDVNTQQPQHQQGKAFKRPEPLICSPVQSKRYKTEMCFSGARTAEPRMDAFSFDAMKMSQQVAVVGQQQKSQQSSHHVLQRAVSLNETMIKNALSRSSSDPDLIGDFTKPFCLPHTEGRHNDLRSISVGTMAQLVRGEFSDSVASFKIVDARYPYEFDGGHIRNAKNLYTQEQILEELVTPISGEATVEGGGGVGAEKRHILVFHCEFSSERGPKLFRFLRSHDRLCNENSYPALHYPEIYLLDGGYKAFYESHPDLCDPINYRQMLDPAYGQEYKTFRAKTKSWNGDNGRATTFKRTKSRSRVLP